MEINSGENATSLDHLGSKRAKRHENSAKDFLPVGSGEDAADRVDGRLFVRVSADANALIESNGEKVVDNLEAVRTRWNVNAADVSDTDSGDANCNK